MSGPRAIVLALTIAVVVGLPASLPAATSCYSQSCVASCTPDAPVGISTLVPSTEFPGGADTPIAMVDPADGRGQFLIATKEGAILVWDAATSSILSTPFLDLRDDTGGPVLDNSSERGLLALAVEPDYAETGRLYVFYTSVDVASDPVDAGDVVVARYTRSAGNPEVADPGSATVILAIDHPVANHNGGDLHFGPDGFLYVSTGDGGGGCDSAQGSSQRTDTLSAKLLRIDVLGVDAGAGSPDCGLTAGNYGVPSDNPFVDVVASPDPCDEIWAWGLRNPFRFTFDRQTGDIYIGDVGQNKWEEINLLRPATPAPVNFGWVCREGCESADNDESFCTLPEGCPEDTGTSCQFPRTIGGFWDPILCHYNGGWDSIISGYRYRGSQVPSIAGDYLYADVACGQIWKTTTLDPTDPAAVASECWASGYDFTYAFAEDQLGELYLVNGISSRIDCIHNGDGCTWAGTAIFTDGFESGDTSRWSVAVP